MNKIFAISSLERIPPAISLKCNPERAIELRATYMEVQPGYHLNKQQWNTINPSGRIPEELLRELIDHSYELIVQGLKRADREALSKLNHFLK